MFNMEKRFRNKIVIIIIIAIKFDRVEIAFTLALFYWLRPLTEED